MIRNLVALISLMAFIYPASAEDMNCPLQSEVLVCSCIVEPEPFLVQRSSPNPPVLYRKFASNKNKPRLRLVLPSKL
jgi:hypothetical protein